MIKGNGGLDKRACRPFGLAVHNMQLAARPDPTETPEHNPTPPTGPTGPEPGP